MIKKKTFWIPVLIVLVIAAAGGYYYYNHQQAATQSAQQQLTAMQTAIARNGNITISSTGTGQTIATNQISLGFSQTGTLNQLNVAVGDKVDKGQVLATITTSDTPESIAASVTSAQATLVNAQNTLDNLTSTAETNKVTALTNIATYQQDVRNAKYTLENFTPPTIFNGLSPADAVTKMRQELDQALNAFEPYKYIAEYNTTRQDYLLKLNLAQSNYDTAVTWLNYQYTYDTAQSNLDMAIQQFNKYKDGPAPEDVKAAQATLDNAKAQLAEAQTAKYIVDLTTPMSGTVMSVTANVGESVGTTPIISIADLSQTSLDVYLDQTNLSKVAVGYPANVTFDAYPNQTFTGKVIAVNPSLQNVSNVQAVESTVLLDTQQPDTADLLVGMTASVEVVAAKTQNAVIIPLQALHELGPDEYAVFVVVNGQPTLRPVQVGLKDATSAEIKSGLQAGDVVSTGIVRTQ
jgi:HlyD family secretion protein